MKKLSLFFVAAIFLAALCLNVSINATKGAGDTSLVGFTTEAKAECEKGYGNWIVGRCTPTQRCVPAPLEDCDCDPNFE